MKKGRNNKTNVVIYQAKKRHKLNSAGILNATRYGVASIRLESYSGFKKRQSQNI